MSGSTAGSRLCFKVALVVINALFFAIGVLLLGIGAHLFARSDLDHYAIIGVTHFVWSIRVAFIGCGCLILFVTVCGCSGACCENRCLIILYTILLCLLLLSSLAVAILTFIYYGQVQAIAVARASASIRQHYGGNATVNNVTASIDAVQNQFQCCGWTGGGQANIFVDTPWYRRVGRPTGQSYPASCCTAGAAATTTTDEASSSSASGSGGGDEDKEYRTRLCTAASDEAHARTMGYMHAMDCVDKFVETNGNAFRVTCGIVVVAIFLQIWCIALAGITLRQLSSDRALLV